MGGAITEGERMISVDGIIQTLETTMIQALYRKEIPVIAAFIECNHGQMIKNVVFIFPAKTKPRVRYTPKI